MKNYNVLILSAGRRVELVKAFKQAASDLNITSNIITVDALETAPATFFSDKFYLIGRVEEIGYLDDIIKICRDEDIKLIIPTIDSELLFLAEKKDYIEKNTNAIVLVSNLEVVKICRNKKLTSNFLFQNGFLIPKEYSDFEINNGKYKFPLFIKPLDGSSSNNTFKINNEMELEFFKNYVKSPIIQEYVDGEEYSVDVFLDLNSNPITITPRKRLAVRGGEILKGLVIKDQLIINEIKRLVKVLNPIGHITVQLWKTKDGIKFIEINPRFGGGAPMSFKAGANSPENLYKILMGEQLTYRDDYLNNLLALRFDDVVYIHDGAII